MGQGVVRLTCTTRETHFEFEVGTFDTFLPATPVFVRLILPLECHVLHKMPSR